MAFSLDPVDFFAKTSGFDSDQWAALAPTGTKGQLGTARQYHAKNSTEGEAFSPMLPESGVFSSEGTSNLFGDSIKRKAAEWDVAGTALGLQAEVEAAKRLADAQRSSADAQRRSSNTGAIIGAVGSVGAAVVGGLI
jgi:hypothetical protein